jgi:hypothetical protein
MLVRQVSVLIETTMSRASTVIEGDSTTAF